MPTVGSVDLSYLRDRQPPKMEWYLAMAPYGDPCFTALVNSATVERGEMEIPYDGDVGEANVQPGMTVWIGAASGSYCRWSLRIRSIDVTANILSVGENSHIPWGDNFQLTCPGAAGFREIWGKYPRLVEFGDSAIFYKDYDIPYTNEGDHLPPKANGGPPSIAWIDPTSGVANLNWVGEDSRVKEVGHGWATTGSFSWVFPDGTPPTSILQGTRDSPVPVTFNTSGFRYVELQVMDDLGSTGTTYIPTWIFEKGQEDPFMKCEPISQESSERGPALRIKAWQTETAREDVFYNFPDGALVVMFTKTWWKGTQRAIGGYPDRGNIQFAGWLDGETVRFGPSAGEVEFEAIGSDGVMVRIPSFGFSVEDDSTPSDWYEQKDCNVDRALHHLLQYHSTVNEVCHVDAPDEANARRVAIQHFPDVSLYDQAQESLLKDAQCRLTADRQGILKATRNPQFMSDVDRDSVIEVCDIGDAQWADQIEETTLHMPQVGKIRLGGFVFDAPILSQAPGVAPLQQEAETIVEGRLLIDQDEANRWSGQALAMANNPYPQVPLTLRGHWPIFDPADQEWITLTVTDPLGRNVWDGVRFVVREVAFGDLPKLGTSITQLTLEKETDWLVGETDSLPEAPPPEESDPDTIPLPPIPSVAEGWPTEIYVGTILAGVYFSGDFGGPLDPMPTWASVNGGLCATTIKQLQVDPFDKVKRQYCLVTTDDGNKVYRRVDQGDWTLILDLDEVGDLTGVPAELIGAICTNDESNGYIHVLTMDDASPAARDAYHIYSSNHGDGWNFNKIKDNWVYDIGTIRARGSTVYAGVNVGMGGSGRLYYTSNMGAGWDPSDSLGSSVWKPFPSGNLVNFSVKYCQGRITGTWNLCRVEDDDSITVLQYPLALGQGCDSLWFSEVSAGFQRVVKYDSLYVTQNSWATVVDSTPGIVNPNPDMMISSSRNDEDLIIMGSRDLTATGSPHVVFNMEDDDTLVAVGRAGPNAGSSPFADSIPYMDGGNFNHICCDGIQPVSWD